MRRIQNKEYPMFRSFVCAVVVLPLCVGLAQAQSRIGNGRIKKVDREKGVFTVTKLVIDVDEEEKKMPDTDFTVGAATKFVIYVGEKKNEITGKDGLKNPEVKEGAKVTVISTDGKLTQVRVNPPKKKEKK